MGGWDVKIFDCVKNPIMFLWACCVPCGGACMQALDAKLTESDKNAWIIACLLDVCCGCIGMIFNRYRLRNALSIHDSIILDILFSWFLPCCAVTQEYMQTMDKKGHNQKDPIWKTYKS